MSTDLDDLGALLHAASPPPKRAYSALGSLTLETPVALRDDGGPLPSREIHRYGLFGRAESGGVERRVTG
jgi:hypothetical protein